MFTKLLQRLEDPLHPLLGPTLWGLQTWGMWQSNKRLSRTLYYILHLSAIIFVFTQYVELWLIRFHLEEALRNLSVTMLSTVCVVKAGTFVLWQNHWKSVIHYVSTLERRQLAMKDNITERIMKNYTKYSRTVTYFYWCLVTITVFTVILAPLVSVISSQENMAFIKNGSVPYPEIMSSWAPFDKSRGCGYWVLVMEHSLICFYGGGIVGNYDSNAVVLMSFFAGQLKLLKINCARLFEDDVLDYKVAMARIRECHLHHLKLVQNAKMLDSLLSPVMFLYVIICSLMICASAVQLTTDGTTRMQQIWIAEYLVALIAQLFLYCWHSDTVLQMSVQVEGGVYESTWWTQEARVRRSIVLLAGQLRRSIVFSAGPFAKLTVSTFVAVRIATRNGYTLHYDCHLLLIASCASLVNQFITVCNRSWMEILKASYSYYTLLSKKEN